MNRGIAQKVVVTGAVIVTVLALVFPPWIHTFEVRNHKMTRQGNYAPFYRAPYPQPTSGLNDDEIYTNDYYSKFWSVRMDSQRMVNELGIIWVVAGFALYLLRSKGKSAQ
ncbi:MAG: hypothetical protein IH577_03135 [Deltaproteobacteria bacterium]|nr:hypothetical protein [Deltaproteobacteria bacterium]